MIETSKPIEKAILVGIIYPGQDEREVEDFLEELSFLTETAGAVPVKRFIQKLDVPNPRTFVGSGKIEEIALFVQENSVILQYSMMSLPPVRSGTLKKLWAAGSSIGRILFLIFLPNGPGHLMHGHRLNWPSINIFFPG